MSDQHWNADQGTGRAHEPYGAPQPGAWQPGPPAGSPRQWYGSAPGYGQAAGYGPPPGYVPPLAYAPNPGYGPHIGYGGYPPPQRTNGMAVASMVLGILWIYWIGSILALIFGYIAQSQIRERGEGGAGMAVAGIVLGWIGVGVFGLVILFALASST